MSIDNLQHNLPYRQFIIYNNGMSVYNPYIFAAWLERAFKTSSFKTYSALADAAGLQRSTVGSLINAKDQPLTEKPSQPTTNTVIKLATALEQDIDEALLIAGHAPRQETGDIQVVEGIKIIFDESYSNEQKEKIVETLGFYAKGLKSNDKKGIQLTKISIRSSSNNQKTAEVFHSAVEKKEDVKPDLLKEVKK